MICGWEKITAQENLDFLSSNAFHYMFFNSYIYKPYLRKLDRYGFKNDDQLLGVVMVEKVPYPSKDSHRCINSVHVAFSEEVRGKEALGAAKKWLSLYLPSYKMLQGDVPKKWPKVLRFAKWLGFNPIAETARYTIVERKIA